MKRNILLAGALSLLVACNRPAGFSKEVEQNGNKVVVSLGPNGRTITVRNEEGVIRANDYNNDGAFDELKVIGYKTSHLPKESHLRAYASFDRLERVYAELK